MEVEIETTDEEDRQAEMRILNRSGKVAYLPTAEEIAESCAKIQVGWTDDEQYRRLRGWRVE